MKLSVVIVNYNVKHFLEQCLHSVYKAAKGIETEIFVVDNNSVDGSARLIREKFPNLVYIENTKNVGFSKANNQAIRLAKGEFILLLNPDTVVEEDTFRKVVSFMETHPDAGGLGVKMIDGKGNFLPESKRGLPTPEVAFYKMFGISKLFPRSKRFGRYHLSYLDENEVHSVEVLAGAFMLLRKETLDKIGLLDETFFMYGEDIDLSYRITKAGYKNYYFPGTTIIHYKGESTKKGSLNYVKVFYNAMIIFARKHFTGGKAGVFTFILQFAIWFRALLTILNRVVSKIFLPVTDAAVVFLGYLFFIPVWEEMRFEPGHFPPQFLQVAVPVYIIFWLTGILLSGGYKKPVNIYRLVRGLFWGTIAILLVYSMVSEEYRFSRAMIMMGFAWSLISLTFIRLLFHKLKIKGLRLDLKKTKRIAIAGHSTEVQRVKKLLEESQIMSELAGFIALDETDRGENYLGEIRQLPEIIRINRIDEIIFCAESIPSAQIIRAMLDLTHLDIDYKIAPPESISIIGSNSIHTAGDLYVVNINAISKPANKRRKRIFDIGVAKLCLLFSPILVWFFTSKQQYFSNIFSVLSGRKTWIGYVPGSPGIEKLPVLKPGVLHPGDLFPDIQHDAGKKERMNILYAKDYSLYTDAEILLKSWKNLDRK